jgi:hypothetical protein
MKNDDMALCAMTESGSILNRDESEFTFTGMAGMREAE